jgi:PEP-CTERM motif
MAATRAAPRYKLIGGRLGRIFEGYSSMRLLISAALAAVVVSAMFGALPASATTYNYVGQTYTTNADPTIYGTQMTGSVTFNQDTSNFTGLIYVSSGVVTALNLTSGTITATLPYFDIFADPASPYFSPLVFPGNPNGLVPDYFRLVNGSIQAWLLQGITPSYELVAPSYQLYSQGDSSICNGCGFGFDNIQSNFPTGTIYAEKNQNQALWSITPTAAVPEPSTWAMMLLGFASLGFMAYRRSRKDNGLALAGA